MVDKTWLGAAWLLLLPTLCLAQPRLVSVTPDVTEVLVALHAESGLVGRDSLAKEVQVAKVPVVGSSRALTAAAIMAAKPDMVLGSDQAQPPAIYSQLKQLGIKLVWINHSDDPATFAQGIRTVGTAVGKAKEAEKLAATWLQAMQPRSLTGKRVLLSYDGRLVAGTGTAGDAMLRAAGAVNAAAGMKGFLPMTPEAWLQAKPDIVIVAEHNKAILGGLDAFKARPELVTSPAVKNGQVYAWPAADFLRLGVDSPAVVLKLRKLAS